MTVTTTTDAAAVDLRNLPGHGYPAVPPVDAERYWWHLARLREATSRGKAAEYAQSLAAAADRIAAALSGVPEAAPDTTTDPLAWADLSTFLASLAMALRGASVTPDDIFDANDGPDHDSWGHLAQAVGRREFAAAWYPISQYLRLHAGPNGGDEEAPRLRAFTVAQVIRAAAAIIDAPGNPGGQTPDHGPGTVMRGSDEPPRGRQPPRRRKATPVMSQTDTPEHPPPCTTCNGSGQVTITLRNDQTHTDQVITQTCTDCL